MRAPSTSLSRLRQLPKQLKKLLPPNLTIPPDPSYGSLLDETAQHLLNKPFLSPEEAQLAFTFTQESAAWVRDRFGETSTEYAWEVVKVASVARAIGGHSNAGRATVEGIMRLHYGRRSAEAILAGLDDIFDCEKVITGGAANKHG